VSNTTQIPQKQPRFGYPAIYAIRVIGCLDKSWSKRLSNLTILSYHTTLVEVMEMTTLTGELIDQGALIGVLNTLYNLRLTIWSVECLGTPANPYPAADSSNSLNLDPGMSEKNG